MMKKKLSKMKGSVVNVKWKRKQEIHTVQRDKNWFL